MSTKEKEKVRGGRGREFSQLPNLSYSITSIFSLSQWEDGVRGAGRVPNIVLCDWKSQVVEINKISKN